MYPIPRAFGHHAVMPAVGGAHMLYNATRNAFGSVTHTDAAMTKYHITPV